MKGVFLDIDGVVATHRALDQELMRYYGVTSSDQINRKQSNMPFCPVSTYNWPFDAEPIAHLYTLLRKTNCKFVVSSSWRVGYTKEGLQELFTYKGLRVPIYDVTKRFGKRGEEIQEWLNRNPIESYVILDDECYYDILPFHPNNCVNTDCFEGFTFNDLLNALDILNHPNQ